MLNTLEKLKSDPEVTLSKPLIDFLRAWMSFISHKDKSFHTPVTYISRKQLSEQLNTTWAAVTEGLNSLHKFGVLTREQKKAYRGISPGPKLTPLIGTEPFKEDLALLRKLGIFKTFIASTRAKKGITPRGRTELNRISDLLVLLLLSKSNDVGVVQAIGRAGLGHLVGLSERKVQNDIKRMRQFGLIKGYMPGCVSKVVAHRFSSAYWLNPEMRRAYGSSTHEHNFTIVVQFEISFSPDYYTDFRSFTSWIWPLLINPLKERKASKTIEAESVNGHESHYHLLCNNQIKFYITSALFDYTNTLKLKGIDSPSVKYFCDFFFEVSDKKVFSELNKIDDEGEIYLAKIVEDALAFVIYYTAIITKKSDLVWKDSKKLLRLAPLNESDWVIISTNR